MLINQLNNQKELHSSVSYGGWCDVSGDGDCWDEQAALLEAVAVTAGLAAIYSAAVGNAPAAVTATGVSGVSAAGAWVSGVVDGML